MGRSSSFYSEIVPISGRGIWISGHHLGNIFAECGNTEYLQEASSDTGNIVICETGGRMTLDGT